MKLIIAGSRTIQLSPDQIKDIICLHGGHPTDVDEVVSGNANGIDYSGEIFADQYSIPVKEFPADWDAYGKGAGHIRNTQMANYADALLLIWDGESKGSANMKYQMNQLGKPIYEVILKKHNI